MASCVNRQLIFSIFENGHFYFSSHAKLNQFQLKHRAFLTEHRGLTRWAIGRILSKIADLYVCRHGPGSSFSQSSALTRAPSCARSACCCFTANRAPLFATPDYIHNRHFLHSGTSYYQFYIHSGDCNFLAASLKWYKHVRDRAYYGDVYVLPDFRNAALESASSHEQTRAL